MELIKEEKIVNINVEKLEVDNCNLRGKDWSSDEGLINSIKELGVQEPLVIRKTKDKRLLKKGIKNTIVCGSRRWNASIEAGLKKVPCIIRNLTDADAIAISMTENADRKDIPVHRYVFKCRDYLNEINGNLSDIESIKKLMQDLRLTKGKAEYYYGATKIKSSLILELIKPPEERDKNKIKKIIKIVGAEFCDAITQQLSIEKVGDIARELQDFSIEQQLDVIVNIIGLSKETSDEVIQQKKVFPMKKAKDILRTVRNIPIGRRWSFNFGSRVSKGLVEACSREKKDKDVLVENDIVEPWLKKRGYI